MIIFQKYFILALLFIPFYGLAAEPFLSAIPLDSKNWAVAYDGFGKIDFQENAIVLKPSKAEIPSETHAALLLTKKISLSSNFEIEVEYEVKQQLRDVPNPWETFWIFFQYQKQAQLRKKTNYIVVKTRGIEAGRAWNLLDQSFSFTGESPSLNLRTRTKIRIVAIRKKLLVYVNEEKVAELKRSLLYNHQGKIGLYAEDAEVVIYSVNFRKLK